MTEEAIEAGIIERTRQVREDSGRKQYDVAALMGMDKERWRKYETRSPMPAALVPKFCSLMEIEVEYLLTGRIARRGAAPKMNGSPVTLLKPRENRPMAS